MSLGSSVVKTKHRQWCTIKKAKQKSRGFTPRLPTTSQSQIKVKILPLEKGLAQKKLFAKS